jgi:histidinol-phosphate/aromatic aminotransferase/cobyric acid decarboxylase-like protein
MIKGHGGDVYELARNLGCEPADIIDMSSNINPLGPVPAAVARAGYPGPVPEPHPIFLSQDHRRVYGLPALFNPFER